MPGLMRTARPTCAPQCWQALPRLGSQIHFTSSAARPFGCHPDATQMYGGIGMTDDAEIGFFLKRSRVTEQTLGDATFHRSRYTRLSDFSTNRTPRH